MKRTVNYISNVTNIADAVNTAFSLIEELAGEVREVVDNASGTPRENTQRIQTLSETADTLENNSEPSIDDTLEALPVTVHLLPNKRPSRSDRRDEAVSYPAAVIDVLDQIEDDDPNKEAADDLSNELGDVQSNWEAAEFPGMYG